MRVAFSSKAKDDLEEIGDQIAEDNPGRAASFVREVRIHCEALGDNPLAFAERRELATGLRCYPYGNYLVFYRALKDEVRVVRVIHGARDVRQLARRGELNEPRAVYDVSDFEALGFLRVSP